MADGIFEIFEKVSAKVLSRRRRIYTERLVCWLMIWQRLESIPTQLSALKELETKRAKKLFGNCKRLRDGWSSNASTSAYSQSVSSLPVEKVEILADKLFDYLSNDKTHNWKGSRAFALDGTGITLQPTKSLLKTHPPTRNQHGLATFPQMNLVVAHDLMTGYGIRPEFAPVMGEGARSESALANDLLKRLPKDSVVIADRGLGIFSIAYSISQAQSASVLRLTQPRAKKILGKARAHALDKKLSWTPSAEDLKTNKDIPSDASISGRLIICKVRRNNKTIQLHLFTTLLDASVQEVVELYGRRWTIETDIRVLKRTLKLFELRSKSKNNCEKEILIATVTYNLLRAVAKLEAFKANVDPREISFSNLVSSIPFYAAQMLEATSEAEQEDIRARMTRRLTHKAVLNKPRKRPSYPRTVHPRSTQYPYKRKPSHE